jgi:hypothetical protein
MTISIQTLHGVLVGIATTVGIAVAFSLALMAAGAFFERDRTSVTKPSRSAAGPALHPAQADEAHDLVLR